MELFFFLQLFRLFGYELIYMQYLKQLLIVLELQETFSKQNTVDLIFFMVFKVLKTKQVLFYSTKYLRILVRPIESILFKRCFICLKPALTQIELVIFLFFTNDFSILEMKSLVGYHNTSLTYSDVSNNRIGTAIYFQKIILPICSYQRHVF